MSGAMADIIGFVGMACILFAYAYATQAKAVNPMLHHGANLVGALLLIGSLLVNTNRASLALEAFWAAIALWGLVKALREREGAA